MVPPVLVAPPVPCVPPLATAPPVLVVPPAEVPPPVLDIPVVPPSMLTPPVPVAPPLPKAPPAAGMPPLPFELPDALFEQLPRLASHSASAKQTTTECRKVGRWLLIGPSNATHAISSSYLPEKIGTKLKRPPPDVVSAGYPCYSRRNQMSASATIATANPSSTDKSAPALNALLEVSENLLEVFVDIHTVDGFHEFSLVPIAASPQAQRAGPRRVRVPWTWMQARAPGWRLRLQCLRRRGRHR